MTRKPPPRNRVLDRRLWDDTGREWERRAQWLTHDQIEAHLHSAKRVVVHQFGQPLRWLSGDEARSWWRSIQPSVQDAHGGTPKPDTERLTYAAVLWRTGEDKLLGFEAFC
jgi:hypothetical protein